jgi:hypothetical protein
MTIRPEVDIGLFSKRTVLTGAGWTRNWGGQLATEIWQHLMSSHAIQGRASVRQLLLEEPSFEAALGKLQAAPFHAEDRQIVELALMGVFIEMDGEIATVHDPWINIYKVQDLLFRFWGQRGDRVNAGYMFTLNQDLWPERRLYNQHVLGAAAPTLPGLQRRANQRLFETDLGRYNDGFIMQPLSDPSAPLQLRGGFNVIKLHGSFNWRTQDGRNAMIVGMEKTAQIGAFPLLAAYWQIFRAVLQAGEVRLMVVGYGFGDEHVNAVIADAVENHGLRLFIWDTAPNLMDRVRAAPHGDRIWKGVLSTTSRSMIEVFPSNQAETAEYRRILATVFG